MRMTPSSDARRTLGDVFAVFSGGVVLIYLGWSAYLFAHRELLPTLASNRYTMAGMLVVLSLSMVMWGWMLVDCATRMTRERDPYLVGWLVALVVLWPTAWIYYLVQRRRHSVQ
jgi:hypothetical protein